MSSYSDPFRVQRRAPQDSPAEEHRFLLDYWQEKCAGRMAPAWGDISLSDLPGRMLPWIIVADIDAAAGSATYRYWGTELTAVYGADYTGKSALDLPPDEFGKMVNESYLAVSETREPVLEIEEFLSKTGRRGVKSALRLPLSDDGKTVDKVIVSTVFDMAHAGDDVRRFLNSIRD